MRHAPSPGQNFQLFWTLGLESGVFPITQHLTPTTAARGRLVGLGRVELPTSPLSGVRSSHLSYRPTRSTKLVELVGIEPATS